MELMELIEEIKKIKKETLQNYYKIIRKDESAVIKTINKANGWKGCALFHKSDKMRILVYEGNLDGRDDKEITINEFVENYNFFIDWEI